MTEAALAYAPRLRMTALYAVAASENRLVAAPVTAVNITWVISPSGRWSL